MSNVIVKMDSKVLDDLVANECRTFARYIRDNWTPYISNSFNVWWNEKTGRYAYSEELYDYFQSQSKEKVNDKG